MTTRTKSTPKAPPSLATIAANMRREIVDGARYSHRWLTHGLEIVLTRHEDDAWRLAMTHDDGVAPSTDEIFLCMRAFGVPEDTDCPIVEKERQLKKGPVKVQRIRVAEMRWRETFRGTAD